MKVFTLIILIISLVHFDYTNAQVKGNRFNEKQNNDNNRRTVALIGDEINKLVASNEWAGAESALQKGFDMCRKLGNSKLCVAGMNFNGGYLHQQMAIKRKSNAKQYQKRAINYYRMVLKTYPDNQSAMSNMIKMRELDGVNNSTIRMMEKLAKEYPAKRVEYLTRIGNLYLEEEKFETACDYYNKAYNEDPFSEKACVGIVDLFIQHDFVCGKAGQLEQFAYDCNEIGLPNYSEKLIRKQIVKFFNQKNYERALNSIVLWAYILGENGWLDAQQVNTLRKELFTEKEVAPSSESINRALKELFSIFQLESGENLSFINFWNDSSPSFSINDDWEQVRPIKALLRILYKKGKSAQLRKDIVTAEQFWQQALDISHRVDKAFFTFVASDIASLYHANSNKLDPDDKKMSKLIIRLFGGKGTSYSTGEYEMIHRYHTTLGGIYYKREKWEGLGATNALFQLERATSKRYGYTIDPQLKRMLGDTYMAIGSTNKGVDMYEEVITEYLSLDQIRKAHELHQMVRKRYENKIPSSSKRKWEQLGNIISLREEMSGKNNLIVKSRDNNFSYLTKVSIIENEAKKSLARQFVEVQIFKGLSDLAAQIPQDRLGEQQLIYSSALERIADKNELSSPGDYYRINSIKTSFESSVEGSQQLEVVQMNKSTNLNWSNNSKSGYRIYQITALNRQVEVPIKLYELNGLIKTNFETNQQIKTAEYKYNRGKFEKVTKG